MHPLPVAAQVRSQVREEITLAQRAHEAVWLAPDAMWHRNLTALHIIHTNNIHTSYIIIMYSLKQPKHTLLLACWHALTVCFTCDPEPERCVQYDLNLQLPPFSLLLHPSPHQLLTESTDWPHPPPSSTASSCWDGAPPLTIPSGHEYGSVTMGNCIPWGPIPFNLLFVCFLFCHKPPFFLRQCLTLGMLHCCVWGFIFIFFYALTVCSQCHYNCWVNLEML